MKEEQYSSVFRIDSASCSYPHIVIVAYNAIWADSSKTHIVVVTYCSICTDCAQSHIILISDSTIFLNRAKLHVVTISNSAVIEDEAGQEGDDLMALSIFVFLEGDTLVEGLGAFVTCWQEMETDTTNITNKYVENPNLAIKF